MPSYIAFLRAVNVAGRFVKMAELREALVDAGFANVETHIQSGNVFVTSRRRSPDAVASEIRSVLTQWAGFDIPAIVRTPPALVESLGEVDALPPLLPDAKRYLAFADNVVSAEAAATLDAWDKPGERARVLRDCVVADLAIDFHKTTLTNTRIEKITGLTTTWRDAKVVRALAEKWGTP